MIAVLLIVHLLIAASLVGVVLMQRSEGGALGIGGGSGFMTGRGTANFLTRVTASLAAGFFLTSLLLTLVHSHQTVQRSIFDTPASSGKAAPGSSPAPGTPAAPGRGGILDKLAPPGQTGPTVPQSK